MATVKKGSKINFYKFVDADKESDARSKSGATKSTIALTKVIRSNTQAINGIGAVTNSIAKTLIGIRDTTANLLKIDKEKLRRESFVPKFTKRKPIKSIAFDNLFKGKIPSFWEALGQLASALIKFFLVLPALKWLANPENQDKVVSGLKTLAKVFKFIADVSKFAFVNTIEGLYDLLRDDATWMERIGGFVQAMTGLGTAFLALSFLTNPLGLIATFKSVLIFFHKGLLGAFAALARHPLVLGAGIFMAGKYLPQMFPGLVNREETKIEEGLETSGDGMADSLTVEQRIAELKKQREDMNFLDRLRGKVAEIDEAIYRLETGETKSYGFSYGGYLDGFAKGGWISGPQSGYPVSLGGSKPDFIGHGTEYVAQKEGSGDAFIVPFDTPATRVDKGLTERRMGEARSLGFFAEGGGYDEFARKKIKIHEGFNPTAYPEPDGRGMSIGYGHLIKPTDTFPTTISRAFADKLFNEDYKDHKHAATNISGYGKSSPQQKAALIDLTYNMGPGWHKGFPKFMTSFKKGNYEDAGDELKDSLWYNQVGRRGPTIVNLMQNKGLGNGVGQYLLNEGLVAPMATSGLNSRKGFDWSFGLSQLFGGAPASAATLDSHDMFTEQKRDGVTAETKPGSFRVVPTSHPDTGSGWGISGVKDKHGRPLVFSQPAAQQFAAMMTASRGLVKGSDVASSGRSRSKNAQVDGHKNSVHLYGEGLDISGSSQTWMKNNASRFGWKYGYSHGEGSGHYDFEGKGAGETPILGKPGTSSFEYKQTTSDKRSGGRNLIASSNLSGGGFFKDGMGSGRGGIFNRKSFDLGGLGMAGDFMGGFDKPQGSSPFFSQQRPQHAVNSSEQQKIRKVTEQRNMARREINAKTSEIVQMALAAVESQNGSNRQFIQTAEGAIRSLLGAQAGGGTFANVGGTTGTVLRTAVAVLNSFNNPLRGIFS